MNSERTVPVAAGTTDADRPAEGTGASGPSRRWPRPLRRGPLELVACVVIGLGLAMMLQPVAMVLYTWSFATTLVGTAMFVIVSKFPD